MYIYIKKCVIVRGTCICTKKLGICSGWPCSMEKECWWIPRHILDIALFYSIIYSTLHPFLVVFELWPMSNLFWNRINRFSVVFTFWEKNSEIKSWTIWLLNSESGWNPDRYQTTSLFTFTCSSEETQPEKQREMRFICIELKIPKFSLRMSQLWVFIGKWLHLNCLRY